MMTIALLAYWAERNERPKALLRGDIKHGFR